MKRKRWLAILLVVGLATFGGIHLGSSHVERPGRIQKPSVKLIGSYEVFDPKAEWPISGFSVAVHGDLAYFTANDFRYNGHLWVLDVSNPKEPEVVGYVSGGSDEMLDIETDGNFLYLILTDDSGNILHRMAVFDLTDPINPVMVGSISLSHLPILLTLHGNLVYLSSEDPYFLVVDVSDPTTPQIIYTLSYPDLPVYGFSMAIQGEWGYVALDGYGIGVLDLTDPRRPELVTVTEPEGLGVEGRGGSVIGVVAQGNYLYTAVQFTEELIIFDIHDPTSPRVVGSAPSRVILRPAIPSSVAVRGNYAYLASNFMEMYNVRDHTVPWRIDFYPSLYVHQRPIRVKEDLLFVPAVEGLFIYRVP